MSDLDDLAQAAHQRYRPAPRKSPVPAVLIGLFVALVFVAIVGVVIWKVIAEAGSPTAPSSAVPRDAELARLRAENERFKEEIDRLKQPQMPPKVIATPIPAPGERGKQEPNIDEFKKMAEVMRAAIAADLQSYWSKTKSGMKYECFCHLGSVDITRTASIAYPIQGVIKMTETIYGNSEQPIATSHSAHTVVLTLGYKDGKWRAISGLSKVQEDVFFPSSGDRRSTVGVENSWATEQIDKFIPADVRAE